MGFCKIVLVMVALLLCFVPVTAAAEDNLPAASDSKNTPCKGLKPYNNLDELLYQFYINLDSDCLFEMPVEELEEVWNIKILDEDRAKPMNYYPLSETEFYNKPYKSERDAFYIEIDPNKNSGRRVFLILITKEYDEKYGTLIQNDKLPDFFTSKALIKHKLYHCITGVRQTAN